MLNNNAAGVVAGIVATNAMATKVMAKVLHIVNDSGVITTRRPYDAESMGRFKTEEAFLPHENSPMLEHLLQGDRYVQFTAHAFGQKDLEAVTSWLGRWANHGVRLRTGENKSIEYWKFLYGSYTDKGSMIMIPSTSKFTSLDDMGIHVLDPQKAEKYLKRAFAPHQYSAFGKILSVDKTDDGEIIEFELESGFRGLHRNIDLDTLSSRAVAFTDGQNRISVRLMEELGVKDRNLLTYSCKLTAFDPIGLTKGFAHVQDNLKFDIVSYGTKTQVRYDEFFVGILGSLKPGQFFKSDSQSMTNFEEYLWAVEGTEMLQQQLLEAIQDKDKLRGMILSRLKNVSKFDTGNSDAEPGQVDQSDPNVSATEKWMLINALEAGMDITAEPSLFRRAIDLSEIKQCGKGRIPFDHLGMRCDYVPDYYCFDEYGDIHLDWSVIEAGHMVCMDIPVGPVVAYRQPNGMALEHSQAMNIHNEMFAKYANRRRAFVGPDALEFLAPQNGADLDDTGCIIHDPRVVKHVRSLSYPTTDKMVMVEPKKMLMGRAYSFLSRSIENLSTASFTAKDFGNAMERARTMTMKLGQVVLAVQLDTLLSGDHKKNMMDYITEMIQKEEDKDRKVFLIYKRDWLANREDYQANYIATNLEKFIDFCVMGRGDARQFDRFMQLVNEIKNNAEVYPFYFAKQGTGFQGQGRIGKTRRLGVDYILAPSLLCKALDEVERTNTVFMNDLRAHEWKCITPVPMEMEFEFGSSQDVTADAREIRSWFNPKAVAAMSHPGGEKAKRQAYKEVLTGRYHVCVTNGDPDERCPTPCPNKGKLLEDGLLQKMEAFDREQRLFIAVELKRLVHKNTTPVFNEDGTVRGVADGVFGNNIVFNYYLEALDRCDLTGKYVPVDLDQVSLSRGVKNQIFEVEVVDGIVLRKTDHFWCGTVDADNGEYRLVNGMLEVRKPDVSITAEANYVDDINEDGSMPNAGELDV